MRKPIKISLKRTGENYVVASIANAVTVDILNNGQVFTVRVGNTLIESEAEQLADIYSVTVTADKAKP